MLLIKLWVCSSFTELTSFKQKGCCWNPCCWKPLSVCRVLNVTFSFPLLFIYSFFFLKLGYSSFTLPVLLSSKVNQSYKSISPLFPGFISHLGHHRAPKDFSVLYRKFSLVLCFINRSVYMSITFFQFTPPPHFPVVSVCVFPTCVSLFLLCKWDRLYHFSKFHVYVLIYDICLFFSDLLHSVWQSLAPSMSLQMTHFCSL